MPSDLFGVAQWLFADGMRLALVSGHDDGAEMRAVFLFTSGPPDRRIELHVPLERARPELPTLATLSFPASRFERELADLFGIVPVGHPQPRRLVLHQHWPEGWHPMRHDAGATPPLLADGRSYPFVPVEGAGVYEIPVGPVHAGLIEPGHFRFWVVGETILRMKARLWFVHKGIERHFEGQDVARSPGPGRAHLGGHRRRPWPRLLPGCRGRLAACGHRERQNPAGRAARTGAPLQPRGRHRRAVQRRRLRTGPGLGPRPARTAPAAEPRHHRASPLAQRRDPRWGPRPFACPRRAELAEISERFEQLVGLATSSALVMDRFAGTAVLDRAHAVELGVVGPSGRASGLDFDARIAHPVTTSVEGFSPAVQADGDVLARFRVRVDEVRASLDLLAHYGEAVGTLDDVATPPKRPAGAHTSSGVGIAEGWRGVIVHRVEVADAGRLSRVKVVDPSFLNWPALPVSLADTIVPDFPLANKSFNLSYAGNDL